MPLFSLFRGKPIPVKVIVFCILEYFFGLQTIVAQPVYRDSLGPLVAQKNIPVYKIQLLSQGLVFPETTKITALYFNRTL